MNPTALMIFSASMIWLTLFQGVMAYCNGMFSPTQMKARGIAKGLPWIAHAGASWGDLMIVTPICIAAFAAYGNDWAKYDWPLIIAWVVNALLHFTWSRNTQPDCLGWNDHLTAAGWVHAIYMGIALTIVLRLYFVTPHPSPAFLIIATALLSVHVFIGNHKILDLWSPEWWGRTFKGDLQGWFVIVGVTGGLVWRTCVVLSR